MKYKTPCGMCCMCCIAMVCPIGQKHYGISQRQMPSLIIRWGNRLMRTREDLEETDRLVFAAFDRGEFEKKHQREIWNENNKLGFSWNEASLA
jgi:hypothetical protein